MLHGVERLADLTRTETSALSGATPDEVREAVRGGDVGRLAQTQGHFAAVARDGETVRLARTIGQPLRYFVAKRFHGPFLIVSDRIDTLFEWCVEHGIGWQFDPLYTRMVPAHCLVEIDQIGCPDPIPRLHRFFTPPAGGFPEDVELIGREYVQAAYEATRRWLATVPEGEPVGVAFSGGIDSASVLALAYRAMQDLGRDPDLVRAFTLDMGGEDTAQARETARALGLEHLWEPIQVDPRALDLEEAIRVIEDYHPLDVECAAALLALLEALRERHPQVRYLLDGDGGDENMKSYPLEDSDLTLQSILRNPLLYQEGWGVDAVKHSLTYSGGLSRGYVRTYAPAKRFGYQAFSPYTDRAVIEVAQKTPFEELAAGDPERLYRLKGQVVSAGVRAVTGGVMPIAPKRRFQQGALDADIYSRRMQTTKAWCRRVFLSHWEERLRDVWDGQTEWVSGNAVPTRD